MVKKKVLIVEDDGGPLSPLKEVLEAHQMEIYRTHDRWDYVESWLNDAAVTDGLAALVFDLKISDKYLRVYRETPFNKERHYFPSLYFIEEFIKPNYPHLIDRILLYSAFFHLVPAEKISEFKRFIKGKNMTFINLTNEILRLSKVPSKNSQ